MKKTMLHRTVAILLALCTLMSVVASVPLTVSADDTIDSYAPEGTANVALDAMVTISKGNNDRASKENSYEMTSEGWSKANLVDGNTADYGWSTDPYDNTTDASAPVTITLKFQEEAEVSAVALFPHGYFPAAYTISLSTDGETYTQVAEGSSSSLRPAMPAVHEFPAVRAAYAQIHVTQRHVTGEGALVQLGEIAVYGSVPPSIRLDRFALELSVGETDTISPYVFGQTGTHSFSFESSDPSVVSVDASGNVVAHKLGSATITVTSGELSKECPVSVVETSFDFDRNILLSVFWPPTIEYVNDEQYKLMADAGINWVMGGGDPSISNPTIQTKMLELCAKYGIGMNVSDGNFGSRLLGKSEAEIAQAVSKYHNVPSADGFYVLDEPYNPNEYVTAYVALKKANPDAYMHLNFLPGQVYPSWDTYYSQMYDWCARCADEGYPVDYLLFDQYPFPKWGDMDRKGFMNNLRTAHDVALAHGIKTGTYIQAVQTSGGRRPSDSEIRYEMYLSLAFGYKQLSFFTWFTPVDREGPFDDGIISSEGVPNAHYETIKTLNHEILAIGSTLAKCEALEVYLNGETWGQPSIPADFFVQPADTTNYTVSAIKHKETGRNYVMVVNNNYNREQTITLSFDSAVTSLSEVSRTDGSLVPLTMDGDKLTLTLAAGDAMLIALPEDVDFYAVSDEEPAPGTNLATLPGVTVTASYSQGANGNYINLVADGKRISDPINQGWSSQAGRATQLTMNLGAVRNINRVDLYATGDVSNYGATFPKKFEILVSEDGINYTSVANIENCTVTDTGKTVTFDTVEARYVRFDFPRGKPASLCEIEVYNDDGSMGEILPFLEIKHNGIPRDYTEGDNIALNKPTYVSSTVIDTGWTESYVNDGNAQTGWSSKTGLHATADATEYVIIDFGDLYAVDSLAITPRGYFPEDYTVDLSVDGKTWTTVHSATGSAQMKQKFDITLDTAVNARFVRFQGTKLRTDGSNGYLLQVGEIEAYGTPVCDKTALESAMAQYLAAEGKSESDEVYANAVAGMADTTLTQSQANALTNALLADLPPEISEEDTTAPEDETNAPETEADTSETEADTSETEADTSETEADTSETEADALETETDAPEAETDAPEAETNAHAVETNAPETQGESSGADTTADQTGDTGCGSVISAGSAALLTAISAAFVLRKKKES